jgi:hypothetical protein
MSININNLEVDKVALIKKNIHMNRMKGKIVSQITLDDDINIPDRLPDIGNKIAENGDIQLDAIKVSHNKVATKGKLRFKMMYKAIGTELDIHKLEGSIAFDEVINMEGIEDGDTISVDLVIDDLNVSVINSRKICVKAIVTVIAIAENICDEEFAVDIDDEHVEYITDSVEITQIAMRKKDLLRIREEINLSTDKLNINEIIWNTANMCNQHIKVLEDKIVVSGEIIIFVLYTADDGPLQWVDANVPFNGIIELLGCSEEMIPNVEMKLNSVDIEIRPDYDGEQRMLQLDGIVNVDIKLYEEQQFNIIKDAYSHTKDLVLNTKSTEYENLLMKNLTKCKIVEKVQTKSIDGTHIMQVCSCVSEVKVDDITIVEDGLMVEGAMEVSILYICSADNNPLCCIKEDMPFSQKIEVANIKNESIYNVKAFTEQIQANMTGTDEIEVKANIMLDCIVFDKLSKDVITEMEEKDYDMEMISELPGIVGYVTKKGDTQWSVAKKFYTTVESLRSINELKNDELQSGQMLLVVKKIV